MLFLNDSLGFPLSQIKVIAVVSPLEECQQRAAANGRTCDSYDYEQAIDAIPAMVKACNGQFEVVEALVGRQSVVC